jgi:hypothetical protein
VIIIAVLTLALSAAPDAWGQWVQTNMPYGNGYAVQCFAASGSNLYASGSDGEVFRSTDSGMTWISVCRVWPYILSILWRLCSNLCIGRRRYKTIHRHLGRRHLLFH